MSSCQPTKETLNKRIVSDAVELFRYDVAIACPTFLHVACELERFYVRSGYSVLYDYATGTWKGKTFHVVLNGNTGAGKTLFQIGALKQLLYSANGEHEIVIRQMDDRFLLYNWKPQRYFGGVSMRPMSRIYAILQRKHCTF